MPGSCGPGRQLASSVMLTALRGTRGKQRVVDSGSVLIGRRVIRYSTVRKPAFTVAREHRDHDASTAPQAPIRASYRVSLGLGQRRGHRETEDLSLSRSLSAFYLDIAEFQYFIRKDCLYDLQPSNWLTQYPTEIHSSNHDSLIIFPNKTIKNLTLRKEEPTNLSQQNF